MKYTCSCCGYKTLDQKALGTYDICELCGWEDDRVQNEDPDYEGGANGICLREAQYEFINQNGEEIEFEKCDKWQLLEMPSRESRLKKCKTDFVIGTDGETRNA